MTLGENIARLRAERGMSQGALAEALEVSRQSVSKWETDGSVPELEKLVRMSALFGVTLDELVKGPQEETETGTAEAPADGPIPAEPEEETACGAKDAPKAAAETASAPNGFSWRKLTGVLLLCLGFLTFLLVMLLGDPLSGLVLASPLLLCGLICLLVRRHPGLCCGWALYALAAVFVRYAIGARVGWPISAAVIRQGTAAWTAAVLGELLFLAALIFATARAFWKRKP
ncbi:MAG: helix-turn-helix domain-containing protein [Oscillospiraceae bacterium]